MNLEIETMARATFLQIQADKRATIWAFSEKERAEYPLMDVECKAEAFPFVEATLPGGDTEHYRVTGTCGQPLIPETDTLDQSRQFLYIYPVFSDDE
jgi:hypothetical protein